MATETLQYLDPDGLDETVLNIGQIKTNLEGQMQDLPYARPDGLYPDMTVGAVIGADTTAQWATRESTGSGAAIVRSVQGAAVAWNQTVRNNNTGTTTTGITFTNNGDGSWTVDGTASAEIFRNADNAPRQDLIVGHKYLAKGCPAGGSASTYMYRDSWWHTFIDYGDGAIFTVAEGRQACTPSIVVANGATVDNLVFRPQLFDLTAMFGSSNEPATVDEFEQMFPASYYPYSAPTLKPVQIAGIASTDAQGGELDAIEWTAQTLRAAGTIGDMLYSDHVETRVGVVDLGTLNWKAASGYGRVETVAKFAADAKTSGYTNMSVAPLRTDAPYTVRNYYGGSSSAHDVDMSIAIGYSSAGVLLVHDSSLADKTAAEVKAALSGYMLYYELTTPTTTPISPALDMTYRVQAGGSESIIVPDGEVSAAPVLTIAEPVNAGDEFARIWAAIKSLGYTRNAAQLSRPVSLKDIGSIDEAQKDTTDVVEIDTTKEVTE